MGHVTSLCLSFFLCQNRDSVEMRVLIEHPAHTLPQGPATKDKDSSQHRTHASILHAVISQSVPTPRRKPRSKESIWGSHSWAQQHPPSPNFLCGNPEMATPAIHNSMFWNILLEMTIQGHSECQ